MVRASVKRWEGRVKYVGGATAVLCGLTVVLTLFGMTLGPNRWWLNAVFGALMVLGGGFAVWIASTPRGSGGRRVLRWTLTAFAFVVSLAAAIGAWYRVVIEGFPLLD